MKFLSMLAVGLAALISPALAQEASLQPSATPMADHPAAGTIVIFRPSSIVGYAVACPVRWHEREVVELGRGKYAEWKVPPGQYILTNKTSNVQVNVAAGETQYVRCTIKPGILSGRADLQMVDRETFDQHKADYAKKDVEVTVP